MDTTKEMKNKSSISLSNRLDATFWGMMAILFVFWVLITGSFHYQEMLVGLIYSAGVAFFNNDLFLRQEERPALKPAIIFFFLRYCFHLIQAIIMANIQVAAIVLNPRMPISPGMVRFKVNIKKNLSKVILGNSITLTPGTLTIHVEDNIYLVHALTVRDAESVAEWDLSAELAGVERK